MGSKRYVFIAFLSFLLAWGVFTGRAMATEQLDDSVKTEVENELKKAGILGCTVDINVRIDVPESENPYLAESKYAEDEKEASLWALVIKPKRVLTQGPQPTIFMATAYRREIMGMLVIPMISYGYNVVVCDMRGTGSSEGHWNTMGFIESYDVKYIIDDWIPAQSWSDGSIGMVGPSYMGILQMLVAGLVDCDAQGNPIHFKASIAQVPYSDVYADIALHGGNFDLEFITFWILLTEGMSSMPGLIFLGEDAQLPYPFIAKDLADIQEGVDELLASINQFPEPLVDLILESNNDMRSEEFLQKSPFIFWPDKPAGGWDVGIRDEGKRVYPKNLPTVITGGWYDIFTRGCLNQYTYGLKNHSAADKALIVGEWYHIDGSMGLGVNSFMTGQFYARWFNWKIRGKQDPFMAEYPVMLRVMGAERWRAEKEWPLPESRVEHKSLFFSKKKAEPIAGDEFTENKDFFGIIGKGENQIYSLEWDRAKCDLASANPVMEHTAKAGDFHGESSRSAARWLMGIPALVTQVSKNLMGVNIGNGKYFEDERSDDWKIPTFTSEPLEEDVEIVGPVAVRFWARTTFKDRSDALIATQDAMIDLLGNLLGIDTSTEILNRTLFDDDVQFVGELCDVFPDGRARGINSGWLRASHRQRDRDESMFATEHAVDPDYKPFDPLYIEQDFDPELIDEGELYEYVIELWPSCNVFKKGHRIRVTLTGSDWPHLLPILVPSSNEIVIDETHVARVDFTTTNTKDEGKTWKWLTETGYNYASFNEYLVNHKETVSSAGTEDSETDAAYVGVDTESSIANDSSGGCGSSAGASVYAGGTSSILPGMMNLLVTMLIPLAFIAVHRRRRRRRV